MTDRIHGPDVLRGFAAVGVVFFHVLYVSGLPINNIAHSIVGRFDFFVRLFFTISAFSMMYAYHGKLNSSSDLRWFYLKRFFRIAPLFYSIIIFNTVYGIINADNLAGFYDYILSFTFLFPFVPGKEGSIVGGGWSIGVEMLFYIFFPLMISFIRTFRTAFVLLIIFNLIAIIGHEYFNHYLDGNLRTYGLLFYLSHIQYFIIGIAVYYLFENTKNNNIYSKKFNSIFIAIIFLLIIIYFKFWTMIPEEVILSIGLFCLVYFSSLGISTYIDNSITRYFGLISYSIYLIQFPVISLLKDYGFYTLISNVLSSDLRIFIASSVFTILTILSIFILTYHYIEKPGMRLVRLLTK